MMSAQQKTKAAAEAAAEETMKRIRDLSEQVLESANAAGGFALDAYETTLRSVLDFEKKAAEASQVEWISTVTTAHAKFVHDLSAAYTNAARDLLK
jgi:hypothetical protein